MTTEELVKEIDKTVSNFEHPTEPIIFPRVVALIRRSAERIKELEAKYMAARETAISYRKDLARKIAIVPPHESIIDEEISSRIKDKK